MKLGVYGREDRRIRAANRFTITPRSAMSPIPEADEYEAYLERKVVEAVALGLVPAGTSTNRAIHLLG